MKKAKAGCRCGFLKRWQNRLENDPDFWAIKTVYGDCFWMNAAARNLGSYGPVEEDKRKFNDAISFSLKTGTPTMCEVRTVSGGSEPAWTKNSIQRVLCPECNTRGGFVVICWRPLGELEEAN
jgi:hypothetical protein